MDCDRFDSELNACLDQRVDPSTNQSLMAHATSCPSCREKLHSTKSWLHEVEPRPFQNPRIQNPRKIAPLISIGIVIAVLIIPLARRDASTSTDSRAVASSHVASGERFVSQQPTLSPSLGADSQIDSRLAKPDRAKSRIVTQVETLVLLGPNLVSQAGPAANYSRDFLTKQGDITTIMPSPTIAIRAMGIGDLNDELSRIRPVGESFGRTYLGILRTYVPERSRREPSSDAGAFIPGAFLTAA